ncbi:MAG: hypothetical protein A2Y14_00875 [Verrucomicrobia bacterium GWF2_51_19]|nr:MAG: hypothetical protein A2Y14_00875 [Verrucomicrobia bacterium GWF2_51_19]HAD82580.1 hypothetical protein [Candidatus Edwardsbacteria bacterium]
MKLLALFLVACIQSILWGQYSLGTMRAIVLLKVLGYGFALVVALAFFLFSCGALRALMARHAVRLSTFFSRKTLLTAIVIIASFVYMRVHEPTGYKVIMDEPLLVNTSLSMHEMRQVTVISQAHFLENRFIPLQNYVDKRPIMFPFFVSVLHDLTGYRPENAFYLNGGLTLVFLMLCYALGAVLAGRWGGIGLVLLMTGLPILIQTANGAGFELFSLVMLLVCMLWGVAYLKYFEDVYLNALVFSGILLCNVRYENPLYAGSIALLVLVAWLQNKRLHLTLPSALSPFLMIPYLWGHRAFAINPSFWECQKAPIPQPFAVAFFEKNLGFGGSFLFDTSIAGGNSLLLSAGLFCFVMLVVVGCTRWRRLNDETRVLWLFSLAILAYSALLLFYYIDVNNVIARRLTLPLHLAIGFSIVWMAANYKNGGKVVTAIALVYLALVAHPRIVSRQYTETHFSGEKIDALLNYAKQVPQNVFWIADFHIALINEKRPAISIERANKNKEKVKSFLASPMQCSVLIFEDLNYDADKRAWLVNTSKHEPLNEAFVRETLFEKNFFFGGKIRISKLVRVDAEDAVDWSTVNAKNFVEQWTKTLP